MATHAEPGISAPARDLSPYPTDYRSWKVMAWMGFAFITAFFCLWGLLGRNISPFPAWAPPEAVWQNYKDHRLGIMVWSVAVSRVMERIEGPGGLWSKIEMMGGTITCAPLMVACAIWLTAAHEIDNIGPGMAHLLYWFGWLLIDLAYFVTSWQIAGASIVFMRDKREKKLVPNAVSWWGWITIVSFFAVSAIPFVTTGPLAFNGVISFWIAFFTWFFWIPGLSYFIIKAIPRLKAEDEAAGRVTG